jgi:hypothetical protein
MDEALDLVKKALNVPYWIFCCIPYKVELHLGFFYCCAIAMMRANKKAGYLKYRYVGKWSN